MRSDALSPLLQQKTFVGAGNPLRGEDGVDTVAFDRLVNTDDAPCYVMYLVFDRLHSIIVN